MELYDIVFDIKVSGLSEKERNLLIKDIKSIIKKVPKNCKRDFDYHVEKIESEIDIIRQIKKRELERWILEKPYNKGSHIGTYILDKEEFTLKELYARFNMYNKATIRGYINDIIHDDLLESIGQGKFRWKI